MARGHSIARYRAMLDVEYTDGRGEMAIATVRYSSTSPHDIPRPGDEILICRALSGMVTHPNRTLVGLGGGAALIGGLFLFLFGLTWLSMRRKR